MSANPNFNLTDDQVLRRAEQIGDEHRRKEVNAAEREIQRARVVARVKRVVDYVFYVIYGLIGLQILLEVIGAREGAGFKQFMNTVTWPLLQPFHGLMKDVAVGRFQFMTSYIVGLVVYVLLHVAIRGLLGLVTKRRTSP